MKHVEGKISKDTKLLGRKELLIKNLKGKILDIGCGEGEVLIKATLLGYDIIGVDGSLKEIETAKETASMSDVEIDIRHGTTENLPFEFGEFDTILLGEVIEHFPNPVVTIKYIMNFLKPGGKVLITTPAGFAHPDADHKNFFFTEQSFNVLNKYWIFDFLPTMWLRIHSIFIMEQFLNLFECEAKYKEIEYGDSNHKSLDFFIELTRGDKQ